jgi:hypothetical protein
VTSQLRLGALLLADHIYRDEGSGKHVIAGTFHQLNLSAFPATFGRTVGVFISFWGLAGKAALDLDFVEVESGETLMRTGAMEIQCDDPGRPVELALEVPPLPLPRAGRYLFRLTVNGNVLGEAALSARGPGSTSRGT